MVSAQQHPDLVLDYLQQEVLLDRIVVVFPSQAPSIKCHISPFRVISKRSKPGKWRLIVHLSSPSNASVNDGIDRDMCSISYISVNQIVDEILQLGQGALMAKVDIEQMICMVPVHPEDRHLLAVQWEGQVYVDKVLLFGLRSAAAVEQGRISSGALSRRLHYTGASWLPAMSKQSRGYNLSMQRHRKPSSDTGGCRVYDSGWWIQHKWPQVMEDHHISIREMIPIVMLDALWGKRWQRQSVRFWSDNSAVVALINSGSSRENTLMHLMRCLVFIMAHYNFVALAAHIKGSDNNVSDALSKDNKGYSLSHYQQAQSNPTVVSLQELLVTKQPDWTSPHWSQLWSHIFTQH